MSGAALGVLAETAAVPRSEVVAAVAVVDTRLRVVGTLAVRAQTVTFIDVPGPGQYLLRGWDPTGAELRRTVTVSAGEPAPTVRLAAAVTRPASRPAEPPRITVSPVSARLGGSPAEPDLTGPEAVLPVGEGGALLTIEQEGGWSSVTAVPAGATVEVVANPTGGFPRWLPRLAAGSVATLLGYLWVGDLPSAGVVAAALQEGGLVVPGLRGDLLTDLAIGYYLSRHDDPRESYWREWLTRSGPGAADVALLHAEAALRRGGRPPDDVIAGLLAAVDLAMPMLAEGTRRLWHCLGVLQQGRSRPPGLDPAAARVAGRLPARLPSLLATHLVAPDGAVSAPPEPLPTIPYEFLQAGDGWHLYARPRIPQPSPPSVTGQTDDRPRDGALATSWWRPPRFELVAPRAGAEPGRPAAGGEPAHTSPDGALRVVRQVVPGNRLLISLRSTGESPPGGLVTVRVTSGGTQQDYLVPLVAEPSGGTAGAITVPVTGTSVETDVDPRTLPADQLTDAAATTVTRSVRVASGGCQDGWRAIARARPPTDPVRAAVVAAFTDPP